MTKRSDEQFVKEVEKYPHLYVLSHKHFRNKLLKDFTWKAIGDVMNWTPSECIRRWKNLRDRFAREQRARITNECVEGEEWHMMPSLSFLAEHVKHRSLHHNMGNTVADQGGSSTATSNKEMRDLQALLEQAQNNSDTSQNPGEEMIVGCQISEIMGNESPESNMSLINQPVDCILSFKQEDQSLLDNEEEDYDQDIQILPDNEPRQTRKRLKKNDQVKEDVDAAILRTLNELRNDRVDYESPRNVLSQLSEDELFCMSITAELSKMSPKTKSFAKMSIQKLLHDIKFGNSD